MQPSASDITKVSPRFIVTRGGPTSTSIAIVTSNLNQQSWVVTKREVWANPKTGPFRALFHYRQILRPGTHFLLVASGHYAAHLQDVRQIMRRPCGEELAHGDCTQRRMRPFQFK